MLGMTKAREQSMFRHIIRQTALATALILAASFVAGAAYYSSQLNREAFEVQPGAEDRNLDIVAFGAGAVTVRVVSGVARDLHRGAVMGLSYDDGYIQMGEVTNDSSRQVTRKATVLAGLAPSADAPAGADSYAFPADPGVAGLNVDMVTYESPLGPMDAWFVDGRRSEWIIHVHGKGSSPQEAIRLMRPLAGAGYDQLAITYRNDPGQPPDPTGLYQYGQTEYLDLDGAVQYALDRRATDIILVGYGTGAAIVTAYLYRAQATAVKAAIFDSPNLDLGQTVDFAADHRSLPFGLPIPRTMMAFAKVLTALRLNVNWDNIDYLRRAGRLVVPILVFHGGDDQVVPIAESQELEAARSGLVTLIEVPGAGHVGSWNVDPIAYEERVLDFVAEVTR